MNRITAKPRRGRPKDPGKRVAILNAAKHLFAQSGLAGTSMEAIAAAAGVSKLTLYSHFRKKEELFQQAVIAKCEEHAPPAFFEVKNGEPLRARLLTIAVGFLTLVMSKEAMDLYRMMAAEARGNSRLGKLFYAAGPQRTLDQFSRLLVAATRTGELHVRDPQRAASHFFCLLKGTNHLRVMMGARSCPSRAEMRAHIEDVVDLFLRAYAPRQRQREKIRLRGKQRPPTPAR